MRFIVGKWNGRFTVSDNGADRLCCDTALEAKAVATLANALDNERLKVKAERDAILIALKRLLRADTQPPDAAPFEVAGAMDHARRVIAEVEGGTK